MSNKLPRSLQKGIVEGHKARKRFGQNFLEAPHIIANIVSAIAPQMDDLLVEIGPGLGAITTELIEQLNRIHVVELDRDLIPFLIAKFEHTKKLTIHNNDALKFDFSQLISKPGEKLRVVGNLPYNISTPLIFHLLEQSKSIKDMHFMLQKEVVERLAAGVGDKAYGRLGIMVQYHCKVEPLFEVPPESFNPPPKVDSAIVRLSPYTEKPHTTRDPMLLQRVVADAFSMRRKTLRNALKNLVTEAAIDAAGINPSSRAEKVSLEQFIMLTELIIDNPDFLTKKG
ncbi:MAG: 16S rRNA (adenine(1518)-N(6)/adenine(1519)-N(6))-dimethyltransferase RsmA [Pseudomonadales bacterium]|nr:16S rRNA (adenine(1518)-N(6)/adenine(1519)-N(6))-dimethyltransferase RsmA [Pseudomonadales bacterium]